MFILSKCIDYDMHPEYEDAPETEAPQQGNDKEDERFHGTKF